MGIFGFNKASGNILCDLPDRLKNLYREYLDFTKNIDAKYTKAQAENMTNKWCSKKGITVTDGFSGNLIYIRYNNAVHINGIMTVEEADMNCLYVIDETGFKMQISDYNNASVKKVISKANKGTKVRVTGDIEIQGCLENVLFDDMKFNIISSEVKVSVCR